MNLNARRVVCATATDRRRLMARMVDAYARQPELRDVALRLTSGDGRDTKRIALELAEWVRTHVRYVRELGEQLESPAYVLRRQAADCDGHAMLLATLLRSLDLPAAFIEYAPGASGPAVHVAAGVVVDGRVIPLDTTEAAPLGSRPEGEWRASTWLLDRAGARPGPELAGWLGDVYDATIGRVVDVAESLADCARHPLDCGADAVRALGRAIEASIDRVTDALELRLTDPDWWVNAATLAASCASSGCVDPAGALAARTLADAVRDELPELPTWEDLPGMARAQLGEWVADEVRRAGAQGAAAVARTVRDARRATVLRPGPINPNLERQIADFEARLTRLQRSKAATALDVASAGKLRTDRGSYPTATLDRFIRAARWVGPSSADAVWFADPPADLPHVNDVGFARPDLGLRAVAPDRTEPPSGGLGWWALPLAAGLVYGARHALLRRRR